MCRFYRFQASVRRIASAQAAFENNVATTPGAGAAASGMMCTIVVRGLRLHRVTSAN